MKINQYCSVCKKHLDMAVIPTDDAGDDGVIWLRCPECQGFLPKFSGEGLTPPPVPAAPERPVPRGGHGGGADERPSGSRSRTPPAGGTAAGPDAAADGHRTDDADLADDGDEAGAEAAPVKAGVAAEPIAEYAARLAAADLSRARPYRATETYAVDDLIHHLAYGDIGIVVAKEFLPGGRQVARVYFEKTGIVQLIEQAAPDGH